MNGHFIVLREYEAMSRISFSIPDRHHLIANTDNFNLELVSAVWFQPEETCREPWEFTNMDEVALRSPLSMNIEVTSHQSWVCIRGIRRSSSQGRISRLAATVCNGFHHFGLTSFDLHR